ncbi:MAG: transketolase [Planctomycetota bacterium]|nr:transketolase [Planctomycetota bacterium]
MTTATTHGPMAGTPGDVPEIDALAINTIRTLSMDAVQAANSGHPGTPMALAPVAYALWQHRLRYDPADPIWPNRDRFVLSNGHASMLLFSILHLAGVKAVNPKYETTGAAAVTLEDIKRFRQLDSKCPGHPEYRWTSGVETTTGPLGQGIATSVGMAMASRWMGARYNRPGFDLFDHSVFAICGDGCLMEGVSNEAASLAGHLGLSNLCWIYDNNHITIEGKTNLAYNDDVATRFLGYGWHVLRVGDANDVDRLVEAFKSFDEVTDRPTMIIVDSHIGWGAPHKQDTASAHGEPLGEEEIRLAKEAYGWPADAKFLVPDGVRERFQELVGARGRAARDEWFETFKRYETEHPELAEEVRRMQKRELPEGWDSGLEPFPADEKGLATRASNGHVLNAVADRVPWLIGGSADLAPSTKTLIKDPAAGSFQRPGSGADGDYGGRNLHFGIREFAMAAACNGMSLSKVRAYGAGFLIFSDYCRAAIRLSALMEIPVVYVFTHDSIGLGEDGPTHQPIEQIASLRAMPGILLFRPCDANEVLECWKCFMPMKHEPVILALSRQSLPTIDRTRYADASGVHRGGYVLVDCEGGDPEVVLVGTGSEVHACIAAHHALEAEGVRSRVVSLPCWTLFERQDEAYRESVLPSGVRARVCVEQAATFGWERYAGPEGEIVGMTRFGASAPMAELQKEFGFEAEDIVAAAKRTMERVRGGGA